MHPYRVFFALNSNAWLSELQENSLYPDSPPLALECWGSVFSERPACSWAVYFSSPFLLPVYLLLPNRGNLGVWNNYNSVSEIEMFLGHPDDLELGGSVQELEDLHLWCSTFGWIFLSGVCVCVCVCVRACACTCSHTWAHKYLDKRHSRWWVAFSGKQHSN